MKKMKKMILESLAIGTLTEILVLLVSHRDPTVTSFVEMAAAYSLGTFIGKLLMQKLKVTK